MSDLYQILRVLPIAAARSSSGGVAIRCGGTSGFMDDDVIFAQYRPYGGMTIDTVAASTVIASSRHSCAG